MADDDDDDNNDDNNDNSATATATTYPKRLLPPSLSSPQPHGLISGAARSPAAQAAFEARRAEILATMSADQIEAAYQDTAGRINALLEANGKRNADIDSELEKLRVQQDYERRLMRKMVEGQRRRAGRGRSEGEA